MSSASDDRPVMFFHPVLGMYATEAERKKQEEDLRTAALVGSFLGALIAELVRKPDPAPVKKGKRRGR